MGSATFTGSTIVKTKSAADLAADAANSAAALAAFNERKRQEKDSQIADEDRVFARAKQGLDAKTSAQSRLQSERSEQSLTSQKTGIEGNSRLQSERATQGIASQREGTEGQSRLQKEGFEGRGKLQAQTAAEASARRAGDRAASMSLFKKFGKGR